MNLRTREGFRWSCTDETGADVFCTFTPLRSLRCNFRSPSCAQAEESPHFKVASSDAVRCCQGFLCVVGVGGGGWAEVRPVRSLPWRVEYSRRNQLHMHGEELRSAGSTPHSHRVRQRSTSVCWCMVGVGTHSQSWWCMVYK